MNRATVSICSVDVKYELQMFTYISNRSVLPRGGLRSKKMFLLVVWLDPIRNSIIGTFCIPGDIKSFAFTARIFTSWCYCGKWITNDLCCWRSPTHCCPLLGQVRSFMRKFYVGDYQLNWQEKCTPIKGEESPASVSLVSYWCGMIRVEGQLREVIKVVFLIKSDSVMMCQLRLAGFVDLNF